MPDGQVIIELRLDGEEFERGLASAQGAAEDAGAGMEQALAAAQRPLEALAKAAAGLAGEFAGAMQEVAEAAGLPERQLDGLRERFLSLSEETPVSAAALAGFAGTAVELFEALGENEGRGALPRFAQELEALAGSGALAGEALGALAPAQEALRELLLEAAQAGERLNETLARGGETLTASREQAGEAGREYEALGERMETLRARMEAVFSELGRSSAEGMRAAAGGIAALGGAAGEATPGLLSMAAALLSVAAGIAAVEELLGNRSTNKISVDTLGVSSALSKYQSLVKSAAKGGGLSAYAAGTGSAREGWALVGEQGPELLWLDGGERILNATASARFASAGAGTGSAGAAGTGGAYYDHSSLTVQTSDDRVLREVKDWWTHRRLRERAQGGR